MIQVNIAGLVAALKNEPPFALPKMNEGTSYLYNRVYSRMANDEIVYLSDLDFSAFEADDITSLSSLYDDVFERNNHQAITITNALHNTAPVCKAVAYI